KHEENASKPWPGTKRPKWYDYFLAGWRGALEHLMSTGAEANWELGEGLNILVSGSISPSAGLSSSSACVLAAMMATTLAYTEGKVEIEKSELAQLAAKSEHFIGVEGGGMDQAIESLAEPGKALRIDFNPLKWEPVKLPADALFAVLHSGSEFNKGATSYYNQRVVECRIAAQIMAKRSGHSDWKSMRKLRQLAELLGNVPPKEMLNHVNKLLEKGNDEPYTREEVLKLLEATNDDLVKHSLNQNTEDMQQFWLTKRANHVYSEAARVYEFDDVCRKSGSLQELGRLMNESHESCRTLYECSCPELDETVKKCLKAGSLGARLTGAGWGGCAVALVAKADKAKVSEKLDVLFWTEPAQGIEYERFSE
ncbi:galactokinase, partial [Aphelenchoides avenae]